MFMTVVVLCIFCCAQGNYQQQLKQLQDKITNQAIDYEEELKDTKAKLEEAHKSINWSHVSGLVYMWSLSMVVHTQ